MTFQSELIEVREKEIYWQKISKWQYNNNTNIYIVNI